MKPRITLALVASSIPSLAIALSPANTTLPTNRTTLAVASPPSTTNDVPVLPKTLCSATSIFVQRSPHAAMRQDDCLDLAARKQWDPQGAWIIPPRRGEDDYQLIDEYGSCAFYVQRADDQLQPVMIGTEDVFQAIINGSQKYVDGDRMVDSISGMFSCHRGPIRWLLSPNRNPKR
ncbi:hypothetical protein MCOR27_011256 [Pyricularia oryzae]|uniref:Ecp2 effector protein-like domain-containing protein n=5 Tax=Pyricularia TaxID=48558 RepID=A0ABQ8NNV9_PYRGI|nr:uncharacterized protein MGG_03495 [Pyricularia oryzae 70-15]ELQ40360.1 hypothetical protein OOU_Y34scaffold00448g60 [Pyricularia oryzae Y34]KAH8844147.1 hypothetical protein MCOR01_004922 [Pyricularia oryzae]KAI6298615.1 hypothetical protein MCOR33_005265 [Pyricularia grisea]EHA50108.1 hypothetical protein MGG_03495 [Pyricularia oryzae 70-15]KAH9431665.1 hypothetical protein MCOR02_008955 [Pyricularia oryzae]